MGEGVVSEVGYLVIFTKQRKSVGLFENFDVQRLANPWNSKFINPEKTKKGNIVSPIKLNTVITRHNLDDVSRLLNANQGGLMMIDQGFMKRDGEASIFLYHQAEIYRDKAIGLAISTQRGSEMVESEPYQTGWERDREYFFRYLREGEESHHKRFGTTHICGICMNSTVCQGLSLEYPCLAIYIPHEGGSRETALYDAFIHAVHVVLKDHCSDAVTDDEIRSLWNYYAPDLESGVILRQNMG